MKQTNDKRIRSYLRLHHNNRWPIRIVEGNEPPRVKGEPWYYETKGGTYIKYPSAYSKVGWSNMRYVGSTRHIVVGRHWRYKTNEE